MSRTSFTAGRITGRRIVLDHVGDMVPLHVHAAGDSHITIVARGAVEVWGPELEKRCYRAGAMIDFDAGCAHEIVAVVDDTVIFNIDKGLA